MSTSRRDVLEAALATAALSALACRAPAVDPKDDPSIADDTDAVIDDTDAPPDSTARDTAAPHDADVIVVGAGLSGLMTARTLVARGASVILVEARDRVGGRTLNQEIVPGVPVEAGGQWVGPSQTRILDLIAELGLATFPSHLTGDSLINLGGFPLRVDAFDEDESALSRAIDTLAAQIPLDAPWTAPDANILDAMTLSDWMDDEGIAGDDRSTITFAVSSSMGSTPDGISFLWFLFYVHSAGGWLALENFEGGAQQCRIVGGSQAISLRMLDELQGAATVHFEAPVRSMFHNDEGVTVVTDSVTVRGRRAVLTTGPKLADAIQVDPPLPLDRRMLQRMWGTSGGYKAHVSYDTPFWRADDLDGHTLGFGVAGYTVDNSPPDAAVGVIMAFADERLLTLDPDDRRDALAEALVGAFGPQARQVRRFTDHDWGSDPWCNGAVSPLAPGVLTAYGSTIRTPVGRIHWAGTDTSPIWNGYMEGAVRAGERAGNEVADALEAEV